MKFDRKELSNEELIHLYKLILKPRVIEERMLKLLRQGRVSKWFSGIGQEGIAVGVTAALHEDEYVCPLHRNLGVFTTRNCDLQQLFEQFQGKAGGFSQGRERSFHFGTNEHHIVGMISHLGPQLCVADGIALANKLRAEKKIAVAFTGDGGTSEGDFHEACNIAAVWDLPVILLIENNGYGLSTPTNEQFRCKYLAERAAGYGMKGITIDGNNILEVYHTVKQLAEDMRENPKPVLLECMTFRMRGHEEASGVKYVPKELFEIWEKKDPVMNYENWLIDEGIISPDYPIMLKEEMDVEVRAAFDAADKQPDVIADTEKEVAELYMAADEGQSVDVNPGAATKPLRLVDAVREGLMQSMERHDNLVVMGQDVAEYGGVFKVTEGFVEMFGKERVRNTPLCESGILSAALGMSVKHVKSVVEMQFADFVSTGFNAIVNNLAKSYWRWGQNADVVVRMPTGAGVGAGPFHSQSNEAWFFHTPGLKVVYPSTPYDAKGLLCASINDPNPVMFFEHKALYRGAESEVPSDYYTIEIGKANVLQEGDELSIITYGAGVHWAKDAATEGVEILDLRTLLPFDKEAIATTVKKTGKVLVLHEDTLTGGIGAEIAAWITENLFEYLDAPVMRLASLDTPVPFAIPLEKNFLPKDRLKEKVEALMNY